MLKREPRKKGYSARDRLFSKGSQKNEKNKKIWKLFLSIFLKFPFSFLQFLNNFFLKFHSFHIASNFLKIFYRFFLKILKIFFRLKIQYQIQGGPWKMQPIIRTVYLALIKCNKMRGMLTINVGYDLCQQPCTNYSALTVFERCGYTGWQWSISQHKCQSLSILQPAKRLRSLWVDLHPGNGLQTSFFAQIHFHTMHKLFGSTDW